jgi:single-stranded-DNA-specific exonuclease
MKLAPRTYDKAVAQALLEQGCPTLFAPLYAARGVTQYSDVHPGLAQLLPPDSLKNAALAANCLADAITQNQSICVVADYDCDGATACAVAVLGLGMLGAMRVDFLVPNRFKNGYGLTPEVVEQVAIHPRLGKPDWIVTVDNGISSVEGVDTANALGIKVLITDHHLSATKFDDGSLPKAAAILNPNQPGCTFASKDIAGVGVLFYALLLTRAELRRRGVLTPATQPKLDSLLDLVAIGTVADVVRLDANNRALVAAGLDRIRKNALNGTLRPGVAALFNVAAKDAARATTADIGFAIGPRINAAGRLDDMSIGIACLMTTDVAQANRLANELQAMNLARRELEGDMQASAHLQAEAALAQLQGTDMASGLVLYEPSWHQGVVGLVASRIKENYWRPTFAFAPSDDGLLLRGSGRSIPGFHLRDALDHVAKRNPNLIHKFGGHAMAAGLTLSTRDLEVFQREFCAVCTELLSAQTLARILLTDTAPTPSEMTVANIAALDAAVWGQGFEPPIFESDAQVLDQRILKGAHLKLKLNINGMLLDAIWFGQSQEVSSQLRIAYRLSINEFRGNQTLQAMVEWAA